MKIYSIEVFVQDGKNKSLEYYKEAGHNKKEALKLVQKEIDELYNKGIKKTILSIKEMPIEEVLVLIKYKVL